MKIFVSYSRRDAGDFANQVDRHLSSFKYDIFTDVNDIRGGDVWSETIETNISNCDIFVVIVTYGALQSSHVENEVLQARKENKKIIPCFIRGININKIKWGLERIQGVEFDDKYELARNLYSKVDIATNNLGDKSTSNIFGTTSRTLEEANTATTTIPTKNNVDKFPKEKDIPQPSKERTEAIPSKIIEKTENTATKPTISES